MRQGGEGGGECGGGGVSRWGGGGECGGGGMSGGGVWRWRCVRWGSVEVEVCQVGEEGGEDGWIIEHRNLTIPQSLYVQPSTQEVGELILRMV